MPPKKKQNASAFYFFMLDRKAYYENIGRKFPNGLKDVADVCGPEWAVLPADSKIKYKYMAKEEKARQKSRRLADMLFKSRLEEEGTRFMENTIESTIRDLCLTKRLAEFKFYLIHINYFCITEGDRYFPAELAVCEFSLAEGITNTYHCLINLGMVPLGYRHQANIGMKRHEIPLGGNDGESDLYSIWKNVKNIIRGDLTRHEREYFTPFYTMPDNLSNNTSISCVRDVISYMCDSHKDYAGGYPIFTLDKLFFELKNACADKPGVTWPSQASALSILEADEYSYLSNISCKFHSDKDKMKNCSKSFVQRWAFQICDECCQYLDIELVPGRHVPEQ